MEREDRIYQLACDLSTGTSIKYLNGTEISELTQLDAIENAISMSCGKQLPRFSRALQSAMNSSCPVKMIDDVRQSAEKLISIHYEAIMSVEKWGDDAVTETNRAAVVQEKLSRINMLSLDGYNRGYGHIYYTSDQLLTHLDELQSITLDDGFDEFEEDFSIRKLAAEVQLKRHINARTAEENHETRMQAWKAS